MKKLILGLFICTFMASPLFAANFQAEQTMLINSVLEEMKTFKDDANKIDFLIQKKACIEEAVDIASLKKCIVVPE